MKLGPSRATQEHQRAYLLRIATDFQDITSCALKAHYGEHDIFKTDSRLKLATAVVTRNSIFSSDVALRGQTLKFDGTYIQESIEEIKTEATDLKPFEWMKNSKASAGRYIADLRDLEHHLPLLIEVQSPQETNILSWLKSLYIGSRGFELGSFDPSLVAMIWRQQSVKWDNLAIGYICDIVTLVHGVIQRILSHCCRNERVKEWLGTLLIEPLLERYRKAINQVRFILEVERAGTLLTTNHYLADNIEKW